MTTLIRRVLMLVLAWAGVFAPFEAALANRTITAVTLNGAASVSVLPGATITVAINVTTDLLGGGNPTRWRSTGWRVSTTAPGTVTCINHANHDAVGIYNETFSITAPATVGNYNAYFIAYSDDACGAGASATRTLANGVVVAIPLAITSATLNGVASVTVNPGAAITAVVNVTSNSAVPGFQWRSTGWRIDTAAPGTVTCVNHPNHDTAGSYSETFSVTAPSSSGTDNAYFIAYTDEACSTGPSATFTMTNAVTVLSLTELNSTGGTTATNGLHFYLEDTTKMQVRKLNSSGTVNGQVYAQGAIPPSNQLDNGVFIRANGLVYGPPHAVSMTFAANGGMYNTYSITQASPLNPAVTGVQQSATGNFGITAGPQVSVVWKYTLPQDFLIAEVTVTIPGGYPVSAANPVRYYHVFDTFLGGSDSGCGFSNVDAATNKRIVGTYQPASGGCTSVGALPAGVNVVESFRERSGPPFSSYCASGWQSFFLNGTTNCSVLQAAQMSQALAPTLIDTGIGIEMDFTTAGTHTFSYDFVIGSPTPPYDHLEIQHDGSGTLCPETVTVLACTVSTVPCPAANIVSTGSLTGTITASAPPAVTATPTPFTVGSVSSTASVALQAAAAGTVTLGASGLSTVPANGVKCWNTATLGQSCLMTFANTPCVGGYECQEAGTTYNNPPTATNRNPLYTKLSGTNFSFDVRALQSSGAVATGYTAASGVTVELFDDTTPPASCSAYASPVATLPITFAASDNGRKATGNFNLTNAYAKLRCRVADTNPTTPVYGCSSDTFSVRPSAATLLTSAAAPAPSAAATPIIKAGANFNLRATTSTGSNYAGSLARDANKLTAQITTQDLTQASGGVVGTLSPDTLTGNAAAVNATYSEVGHLYLAPGAYRDDSFTVTDQPGSCATASPSNCDCVTDTTGDANLSDVLSGGKYGCSIGNKTASMGRFVPDHFSVTSPAFTAGCGVGAYTYMAQPFSLTASIEAQNSTNARTRNYSGVFAKGVVTTQAENSNSGTALGARVVFTAPWATGAGAGAATYTATQFTRPTTTTADATWGAFDALAMGVRVVDMPDGVLLINRDMEEANTTCTADALTTSNGTCTAVTLTSNARVRFGRLRLQNAYGSELLGLSVPLEAQFWNGGSFTRNTLDTCTSLSPANVNLINYQGGITGTNMGVSHVTSVAAFTAGASNVNLSKPSPAPNAMGSLDLILNLGSAGAPITCPTTIQASPLGASTSAALSFLSGRWCTATSYDRDPTARATFGVFRSPLIYRRENY